MAEPLRWKAVDPQLRLAMEPVAGALWRRRAAVVISSGLAAAALWALAVVGGTRIWPLVDVWLAVLGGAGLVLAAAVLLLLRRPPPREVAEAGDQAGLKERLVTALELGTRDGLLVRAQRADTIATLGRTVWQRSLQVQWPTRRLLAALVMGIVTAALLWLPDKSAELRRGRVRVQAEGLRQADVLEQAAAKMAKAGAAVPDRTRQQAALAMRTLAAELRQAIDGQEAADSLAKAAQEMELLVDASSIRQGRALVELGNTLASTQRGREAGEALSRRDWAGAERQLEALAEQLAAEARQDPGEGEAGKQAGNPPTADQGDQPESSQLRGQYQGAETWRAGNPGAGPSIGAPKNTPTNDAPQLGGANEADPSQSGATPKAEGQAEDAGDGKGGSGPQNQGEQGKGEQGKGEQGGQQGKGQQDAGQAGEEQPGAGQPGAGQKGAAKSQADKEGMAAAMEAAAQAAGSDTALGQALKQAAKDLKSGNAGAAAESLRDLAKQAGQAGSNADSQQDLSEAMQQMQDTQKTMAQAGQPPKPGEGGQGMEANPVRLPDQEPDANEKSQFRIGKSKDQEQGQGQRPNQRQNKDDGSDMARAGSSQAGTEGDEAAMAPELAGMLGYSGTAEPPRDYRSFEMVSMPTLQPTKPDLNNLPDYLPGALGEGSAEMVETESSPMGSSVARPYSQVYAEYAQAARSGLERSELPAAYEAAVKRYFTNLMPEGQD